MVVAGPLACPRRADITADFRIRRGANQTVGFRGLSSWSWRLPPACFASIPATPVAHDDEAATHLARMPHVLLWRREEGGWVVADVDRITFEASLTLVMLPFA